MAVNSIGASVTNRLEKAGFTCLADFKDLEATTLYARIRAATTPIWGAKPHPLAVQALQNLIDAANRDGIPAQDDFFPNPFDR